MQKDGVPPQIVCQRGSVWSVPAVAYPDRVDGGGDFQAGKRRHDKDPQLVCAPVHDGEHRSGAASSAGGRFPLDLEQHDHCHDHHRLCAFDLHARGLCLLTDPLCRKNRCLSSGDDRHDDPP